MLVSDFLRRAVHLYPDRDAIVSGDLRFTYRQFDERVNRLANALLDMGVQKGDRVALLSPNSHQFLECFYGVTAIGAVLVPLNYRLVSDDFVYIINHAEASVFIVDAELTSVAATIAPELTSVRHRVMWSNDGTPIAEGWTDYEALISRGSIEAPPDAEIREND